MELINRTKFLSDIEKEIRDNKFAFVIDYIKERPEIDLFGFLYDTLDSLIASTRVDLENSSGIFKEYEYRTRIDTLETVKEIIKDYEEGLSNE